MSEFLTYSKFHTREESKELSKLLYERNIQFKIEEERDVLDKIFVGETFDPLILLKIKNEDFDKVNEIALNELKFDFSELNKNYYLLDFTKEELINVVNSPLDWNYFDQALAKKLLQDQGVNISDITVKKNIEDDFKPIKLKIYFIILQYIISILLDYSGIIIGIFTLTAFKVLPNGKKVKMFDKQTRFHSIIILLINIIRTSIFFIIPFLK